MNKIKLAMLPAALISALFSAVFCALQYHLVRADHYDSSGVVYFLYSIPAQAFAVFFWLTHRMPTRQALAAALLGITPLSLVGAASIFTVYLELGGGL